MTIGNTWPINVSSPILPFLLAATGPHGLRVLHTLAALASSPNLPCCASTRPGSSTRSVLSSEVRAQHPAPSLPRTPFLPLPPLSRTYPFWKHLQVSSHGPPLFLTPLARTLMPHNLSPNCIFPCISLSAWERELCQIFIELYRKHGTSSSNCTLMALLFRINFNVMVSIETLSKDVLCLQLIPSALKRQPWKRVWDIIFNCLKSLNHSW